MTAHALMYVDKATFFRFVTTAPETHRYEFARGWIMQQQAGGTLRHALVAARVLGQLLSKLDPEKWFVTGSDRAIESMDTVRYAEVVVESVSGADDASLATQKPVMIVEVLSPSSEERDLSVKPTEYLQLPSLQAYIVASQDEPLCYVWVRSRDGKFPEAPQVIKGADRGIEIAALGLNIQLAEIYRGITF